MKSPTSQKKSSLGRKTVPTPVAIAIAVIVAALVIGFAWYRSDQQSKEVGAPLLKAFGTMQSLSSQAKERWAKEQADAKAQNRPLNEAFRPGPNMAPINGVAPMRMGPGASRAPGGAPPPAPGK